jgi:hypothetical protein
MMSCVEYAVENGWFLLPGKPVPLLYAGSTGSKKKDNPIVAYGYDG